MPAPAADRRLVLLLLAAGIVAAFHVGKAPPALPSLREALGASLTQAGWVLATVNLVTAVGGMATAMIADRLGHWRLVVGGTLLGALASAAGAAATRLDLVLALRIVEGVAFIAVVASAPALIVRASRPEALRTTLAVWSTYMPIGSGLMMLAAAGLLALADWRLVWGTAAFLSLAMGLALMVGGGPRGDTTPPAPAARSFLGDARELLASPGPLAIALCFGSYAACWFAVVGFLPTLQVERLGMSPTAAAVTTAIIVIANATGNVGGGWLLGRGVSRGSVIAGSALPLSLCLVGLFVDGLPDLVRLALVTLYSAAIGVVPGALFTGITLHAPRPALAGAATGLLMQGSNVGGLIGPPITAAVVSSGGWPAAAWVTTTALLIVAACGLFLQGREARIVASRQGAAAP